MLDADDFDALLASRLIHLAAERKSVETRKSYETGVRQYLGWCDDHGHDPALDRATVNAWVVDMLDAGRAAKTVRLRQLAVRRFSAWLEEEGEIAQDLLLGVKPPKADEPVVESLDGEQLRALLDACAGREFADRRDTAIVRLMVETGARAGECADMLTTDVDVARGLAVIRRGKGGKGRHVPFGPQTGQALDRYVRARRKHRLASTARLWLGERGQQFHYPALYKMLKARARHAGLDHFHPHMLRHTFASRWLAAGGSEGGLMAVAGWSRRELIDRYVQDTSERRAADEARRLGLGDL